MTRNTIPIGEAVDLSDAYEQMSEQRFRKVLAGFGDGTVGLSQLIKVVEGAEPEGEPLVHTRGQYGEPQRVRIVSGHRHSVITHYATMSMRQLEHQYPDVISVGVLQQSSDEDDLAYEFVYDGDKMSKQEAQQKSVSQFRGVPVEPTIEDVEAERDTPDGVEAEAERDTPDGVEAEAERDTLDGPIGGDAITVADSDGKHWVGTATGVFYNRHGVKHYLTNEHVGDGGSRMYSGGQPVGRLMVADEGTDTSAYVNYSHVNAVPSATKHPLMDIQSVWAFAGITDAVSREDTNLPVELYGAGSGHLTNEVRSTRRSKWYNSTMTDYDVRMEDRNAQGGDSGGPWMHQDFGYGALLAQHVGGYSGPFVRNCDVGSAGWETLRSASVQVSDPS